MVLIIAYSLGAHTIDNITLTLDAQLCVHRGTMVFIYRALLTIWWPSMLPMPTFAVHYMHFMLLRDPLLRNKPLVTEKQVFYMCMYDGHMFKIILKYKHST